MPKCLECGFEAPRLQWTHFKYKCTGKFKNGKEYQAAYPGAKVVDAELAKQCAITLERLIVKYGETDGQRRWDRYREKQARTNTLAYKQEKYGWTEEEFKLYNKSRAVTLENLIIKHGEAKGTVKWISYCERQAYTNTKEYFIEKYGCIAGTAKYDEVCRLKCHSAEAIMERNDCTFDEAKQIRESYKPQGFSSNLEREVIAKIEDVIGKLDYTVNGKQYCVYANDKPNFYDIVHNRRAIEVNGDYWHCNPSQYPVNYYHPHSGMLAEDIWEKDRLKIAAMESERNIKTLVIWESEYNDNPTEIIKRCITWLTQKDKKL